MITVVVDQLALEAENKVKQILIQKIKNKAAELGRVPRQSDFNCQQRFYAVFGSWNEALRAAGFPVAKVSLRLKYRYLRGQEYKPTIEDCIESLKRLSEMLGNCRPTSDDIESEPGVKAGCILFFGLAQTAAPGLQDRRILLPDRIYQWLKFASPRSDCPEWVKKLANS